MGWKINKLIMIRVSSIVHMPLLHSLALKAKLIQVTRTATKHANVNFLAWIWSIFLHTSLGVEGWFEIGWVVGFDRFECFFLFVIIGARNKLGITLFTFILTSLKINTQFVCGFSCTLLNSTQVLLIIFSLIMVLSRCEDKYTSCCFSSVFSLVTCKSLPLRVPQTSQGVKKPYSEKNDQVFV
jgi:hypothetical protein